MTLPSAHVASRINAQIMVVLGTWAYLSAAHPSPTTLIPIVVGGMLLALNKGVQRQDKTLAHLAVLLTTGVAIGLLVALWGAAGRGGTLAMLRILTMLGSCGVAMAAFIRSFRDARRARDDANKA